MENATPPAQPKAPQAQRINESTTVSATAPRVGEVPVRRNDTIKPLQPKFTMNMDVTAPQVRHGASGSWDTPAPAPVKKAATPPATPVRHADKVFVDIGHGQDNAKKGVFDSGAVSHDVQEHSFVKDMLGDLSKNDKFVLAPESSLHDRAKWIADQRAGTDAPLLSFHVNQGKGHGGLIIFSDSADKATRSMAKALAKELSSVLGRPAKAVSESDIGRGQLAIPSSTGGGRAFLVEMGFLDNKDDLAALKKNGKAAAKRLLDFAYGYMGGDKPQRPTTSSASLVREAK